MTSAFTAIVIEDGGGGPEAHFRDLTVDDLPDHDVLVEVEYSSLNYKDGLAVSGRQKIARRPPLIAGADLAGSPPRSSTAGSAAGS